MMGRSLFTIDTKRIQAVLFDLDGVVTQTAKTHAMAWKELFDEYLCTKGLSDSFDIEKDYRQYVDGKPRYDGVESFLLSRGIKLDRGDPEDSPDKETVCGLGNRKNEIFRQLIQKRGVEVYKEAVSLIKTLRERSVKTAVVSSSKNCAFILEAADITDLFDVCIDGIESERLHLAGKPEPDVFVEAARRLFVNPERSIVVEDAVSGVHAGKKGGFVVIAVDRVGNKEALADAGADTVVGDLSVIELI